MTEQLAKRRIGKMCSARWITFQSRVIRFYMSGQCPEKHAVFLKRLVVYIARIYLLVRKCTYIYLSHNSMIGDNREYAFIEGHVYRLVSLTD